MFGFLIHMFGEGQNTPLTQILPSLCYCVLCLNITLDECLASNMDLDMEARNLDKVSGL